MGTSADQQFFEGAEKLLEVWFDSSMPCNDASLRNIPRAELERLVELARAQIISCTSNLSIDSYVLSESSLFVSDRRFIVKTCGTTNLLNTVEPLLRLARTYAGLDQVAVVNYSRRNFLRPELQPLPHKSFDEEVAQLDKTFDGGAGYCMGRLNQDCWYLYNYTPAPASITFVDQTLEILMSDLDADVMSIFTKETSCSAKEARKLSGIDKLMPPGTIVDDKLFDPCGYSMNGVFTDTDQYFTIHITPEADFSYVSFETNIRHVRYFDLIKRVVDTFKPGKFLITLCANDVSKEGRQTQFELWSKPVPGYGRIDLQMLALPDTNVLYANYKKNMPIRDDVVD